MSMAQVNHILNTMGIVKNFSISKKISKKEIDAIRKTIDSENLSKDEYNSILEQGIVACATHYIQHHEIPGIEDEGVDSDTEMDEEEDLENSDSDSYIKKIQIKDPDLIKVYKQAYFDCKSMSEQGLSKKQVVFYILSLMGAFGLDNEDFQKFNEDIQKDSDDDVGDDSDDKTDV